MRKVHVSPRPTAIRKRRRREPRGPRTQCGTLTADPVLSVAQFLWLPESVQCERCRQLRFPLPAELQPLGVWPAGYMQKHATDEMIAIVESFVLEWHRYFKAEIEHRCWYTFDRTKREGGDVECRCRPSVLDMVSWGWSVAKWDPRSDSLYPVTEASCRGPISHDDGYEDYPSNWCVGCHRPYGYYHKQGCAAGCAAVHAAPAPNRLRLYQSADGDLYWRTLAGEDIRLTRDAATADPQRRGGASE